MIVRTLEEILETERDVKGPGWNSRRLLLAEDGLGYSMTDTVIEHGAEMTLEYKHHLESCYCIEGEGSITALDEGVTHPLKPFTLYSLNNNDRHTLRATGGNMRLVCVFNPPLTGRETHQADGSYAPPKDG